MIAILITSSGNISSAVDVDFPVMDPGFAIRVTSSSGSKSMQGAYRVYHLRGDCRLSQGSLVVTSNEMVLWVDEQPSRGDQAPGKTIAYFEGNVQAKWSNTQQLQDSRWMGRLFSHSPIDVVVSKWSETTDSGVITTDSQLDSQSAPQSDRHSTPTLDWNTLSSPIQQIQYQQPVPSVPYQSPIGMNGPESISGIQVVPNPTLPMSGTTLNGGAIPPNGLSISPEGIPLPSPSLNPPGFQNAPQNGWPQTWSVNQMGTGQMAPPQNAFGNSPFATGDGFSTNSFPGSGMPATTPVPPSSGFGARNVTVTGRSSVRPQVQIIQRPERGDSVAVVSRGVYIQISGAQVVGSDGQITSLGSIDIETDRAVIWMPDLAKLDLSGGTSSLGSQPIELYLDGNIVFRQGQRVIYADRMYYNIQREYGMVLSAEILTPIPEYQGLLRLKADVIQQRSRQNFLAYDAALTSSRLGVPRYWLQSQRVEFEDNRPDTPDPLGPAMQNSLGSGMTNMQATSGNNLIYVGGVPIFYWPVMSTNLADPTFYVSGLKFKNDDIFGTQVYIDYDLYQVLGIDPVPGTRWNFSTDYLSERGFALGTAFSYNTPRFIFQGPATGYLDAWGIQDDGLDMLGSDRSGLTPEETLRGRLIFKHRHKLSPDLEFIAEVGYITDRNFMEQYFERDWDQQKDYTTNLRLRRYFGNQEFDIWAQARINDFQTETEWLPRFDHYTLGQSLLGDRLTWFEHSSVGYANQRVASTPLNAAEAAKFSLAPWESDSEGLRAVTRQELSLPFDAGLVKLVPFISGEAAFYGADVNGDDQTRLTGQAGLRSSLPFWRTYSGVNSQLFDVNGLSHKVTLKSEYFYADSNKNVELFPLYDPLDDNSQEHFRRRFITNTFLGALPPQFDERSYAIRNGIQRYVTAASTDVVEDLTQVRFGVDQRWQTKRGLAGRERIVDLVEFDVDWIFFPEQDRDNFGEDFGAINYDFRYHIGDRLTFLSDAYFDTFEDGLHSISAGVVMGRPGRGDLYLGYQWLDGPISSSVLMASTNYRLSEKWIANANTTFDFGEVGNVGQSLALTRLGESFLVQVGMNVDSGRDNVVFQFNIEPRFLPITGRLGGVGGQLVPPAGVAGLE